MSSKRPKDDDSASSDMKRFPKKIIIGVVIGVVIICSVGVIVAFSLLDSQGIIETYLSTIFLIHLSIFC